jgi:hypothetical protein
VLLQDVDEFRFHFEHGRIGTRLGGGGSEVS